MSFGLRPYFSLFSPFIFCANCLIMVVGCILALLLFDIAFILAILLLSSFIFCSVANALPPLILVVNIVTLNLSSRSLIVACWNSLSGVCFCSNFCCLFFRKIFLTVTIFVFLISSDKYKLLMNKDLQSTRHNEE